MKLAIKLIILCSFIIFSLQSNDDDICERNSGNFKFFSSSEAGLKYFHFKDGDKKTTDFDGNEIWPERLACDDPVIEKPYYQDEEISDSNNLKIFGKYGIGCLTKPLQKDVIHLKNMSTTEKKLCCCPVNTKDYLLNTRLLEKRAEYEAIYNSMKEAETKVRNAATHYFKYCNNENAWHKFDIYLGKRKDKDRKYTCCINTKPDTKSETPEAVFCKRFFFYNHDKDRPAIDFVQFDYNEFFNYPLTEKNKQGKYVFDLESPTFGGKKISMSNKKTKSTDLYLYQSDEKSSPNDMSKLYELITKISSKTQLSSKSKRRSMKKN